MTSGIRIGGYHKNGNKNQRDNFCQKTDHFCKLIKRVSFFKKNYKTGEIKKSLVTDS